VLLGLGSVKLLGKEAGKSTFDHSKSQSELSLQFRPVEETLKDVLHDMSGRQ